MCGLCGVIDSDHHWAGVEVGSVETAPCLRRRERLRLAALATDFLRPTRMSVEDFGGRLFIVRSATGASEIVTGLPEVWRATERMLGRRVDLLDPLFTRHPEK